MKAFIKQPGEDLTFIEIDNTLEALQEAVEGYIEAVGFAPSDGRNAGVCVICNEEGRFNDMPYNCEFDGVMYFGPILFVGVKGEDFTDFPMAETPGKMLLKSFIE